jgi:hypothetical protein
LVHHSTLVRTKASHSRVKVGIRIAALFMLVAINLVLKFSAR